MGIKPVTPAVVVLRDYSLRGGIGGTKAWRVTNAEELKELKKTWKGVKPWDLKHTRVASAEKKD